MYDIKTIYALAEGELVQSTDILGAPLERRYWPAASRWAQVLRLYPLVAGWRTEVVHELLDINLVQGARTVLFTASLFAPSGARVANGTALVPIAENKDWEAGETNARGNLAKALGFPSDIEDLIRAVSGPTERITSSVEPEIVPVTAATVEPTKAQPNIRLVAAAEPPPVVVEPAEMGSPPIQHGPPVVASATSVAPEGAPSMLTLNQIASIHSSKNLGPMPGFTTEEQAKEHLRQIRKTRAGAA